LPSKATLASLRHFREVKCGPQWNNPAIAERTAAKFAIDFETHIRKLAGFLSVFFSKLFLGERGALGSVSAAR